MSTINMSKGVKAGILLLLVANLVYAFFQHYHAILDGDMGIVMLPAKNFVRVLTDPLGLGVLLHHDHYNATNRFVLHWSLYTYFRTFPFLFQHFVSPIDSVYLSCAFAKVCFQAGLTYVVGVYVSGQFKLFNKDFLLAALLMTPLFQNCGYVWDIGIIDPPVSYAFSYAYSVLLLAIFFLPFFLVTFHKRTIRFSFLLTALLLFLSWAIAFNGPVSAPVVIIVCGFMFVEQMRQGMEKNVALPFIARIRASMGAIPRPFYLILGFAVLMSFYSFFIGRNNIENFAKQMPLMARYAKLPGSVAAFFTREGLAMLLVMIGVNVFFMLRKRTPQTDMMLRLLGWIVLFCAVYVTLLPMGGYRFYRPEIVRRDVMVPVNATLISFYVLSTYYLLQQIPQRYYKIYLFLVVIPLTRFVIADKLYNQFDNSCERAGLAQIAASKEHIVLLPQDCSVMEWGKITDYTQSKVNADMMRVWGITHEEKYYYQK